MNIISLDEFSTQKKCVIYNDLSHISPYYLSGNSQIHLIDEVSFHKKNIYLLSLYFEKIIICTDNISAFTRYTSKDIISKIVTSSWFNKLVQSGIIILCGWGTNLSKDMMYNQIEYSQIYRSDLKERDYIEHLKYLGESSDMIVREPSGGEKDHVLFLEERIKHLDRLYDSNEMGLIGDFVAATQEKHGFVGTMELFPWIDDFFMNDSKKMDAFYKEYFQSWQEYCNEYYAPAITIDSYRNNLPARTFFVEQGKQQVISSLYSPDFFLRFIIARIGEDKVRKILGVKPERLILIRNGDWKIFLEKYHQCLLAASEISWILYSAKNSTLLADPSSIDTIINEIFVILDNSTDLSAIGGLLDTLIGVLAGTPFLNPFSRIFKDKINIKLKGFIDSMAFKEFDPFLRKLSLLLTDKTAIQTT